MTNQINNLLVLGIGVSPNKTDGVLRFEYFCNIYGLEYKIVGDGKIWKGGDMEIGPGGGQKINEILEVLESMDNRLVVICDTFDLFPLAGSKEIIEKYNNLCKPDYILFASEIYCWPDKMLKNNYPKTNNKYRFLNSGSMIGYRDNIYDLIKKTCINDIDDDQLYFTHKYLANEKIILDHKCELFQTLCGANDDIGIHKNRIYNKYTNSYPVFIHGNGSAKIFLNHIENYIEPNPFYNYSFTTEKYHKNINQPKIFFALYIDSSKNTEMDIFINTVSTIDYSNKIIYIYDKNNNNINKNINGLELHYYGNIKTYIFEHFQKSDSEYYFLLEQRCIISKRDVLHELLNYIDNYHRIISPLLHGNKNIYFTNFWGDLDDNGYYKRSEDYMELVDYQKRGLWNVPYVAGAILIHKDIINNWDIMAKNKFVDDIDMQLCYNLRRNTLFMYMINYNNYGYIIQEN